MIRFLRVILPGLILICAGCATHNPQLSTWRDPQFSPSSTNVLALTDRPNPTPQDAELGRMLVDEMQREGFQFVPEAQADFLLTYVLDEVVEKDTRMTWAPNPLTSGRPAPPQTTSQIYSRSYEPLQTYSLTTFVFHSKEIRLFLYTNPKKHPGELNMVWQGSIEAGESVKAAHELLLLRTLLGYFGKDQNGPVRLME